MKIAFLASKVGSPLKTLNSINLSLRMNNSSRRVGCFYFSKIGEVIIDLGFFFTSLFKSMPYRQYSTNHEQHRARYPKNFFGTRTMLLFFPQKYYIEGVSPPNFS